MQSSQARHVAAAGREDFSGATRQLHRDEEGHQEAVTPALLGERTGLEWSLFVR